MFKPCRGDKVREESTGAYGTTEVLTIKTSRYDLSKDDYELTFQEIDGEYWCRYFDIADDVYTKIPTGEKMTIYEEVKMRSDLSFKIFEAITGGWDEPEDPSEQASFYANKIVDEAIARSKRTVNVDLGAFKDIIVSDKESEL